MRRLITIVCCFFAQLGAQPVLAADCVVLLHGLARSAGSMEDLAERLEQEGYTVSNVDYPSTQFSVEELAPMAVEHGINQCQFWSAERIHFVTHSLGGILVRQYFKAQQLENMGRVVMMGPPNNGSEVVDNLKDVPGFFLINGPAGVQLGTSEQDIPRQLGPVSFELGVIAGTDTMNFLLSNLLPNPDDGKVSVESTKLPGMADFVALPVTHTFMMSDGEVIEQVVTFLAEGHFKLSEP